MNTRNWYYRQPVKENELDAAFADIELAQWNIVKDLGLYGLASGGTVAPTGVGTCNVAVFAAYDKLGRRLVTTGVLAGFNFTNDTAGSPTVPPAGQYRWISLVARHGYVESDPRTDGNAATVNFVLTETISATGNDSNTGLLQIISGTAAGSPGAAVRPSVGANDIIIADLILNDTGAVNGGSAGVSYSRVTRIPSLVIRPYDSLTSYSAGDLVRYTDGEVYQAVAEVAPGTNPTTQASWKIWRRSPTPGSYTEEIVSYRNAKRQRVSGIDHEGFPAGHIVTLDEPWLDVNATQKTATGSGGWFGKWNYRINNGGGIAGLIAANGPTTAPATIPWGPVLGVSAFGQGVAAVSAVELVHPLIYMQQGALVFSTAFSLFDGGGSGIPLSNTSWALGLADGSVVSGASTDPIESGGAVFHGSYICRDPNDNPSVWKVITHNVSSGSGTNTAVTVTANVPHFYKIVVLGTAAADDGVAKVLHFIDGVLVVTDLISLNNIMLAPFIRSTASQGEVMILEVGRLRAHARLALNDEFDA